LNNEKFPEEYIYSSTSYYEDGNLSDEVLTHYRGKDRGLSAVGTTAG